MMTSDTASSVVQLTPPDSPESGETRTLVFEPSTLSGEVTISGAKNSVLRLMAASLLTAETITLDNYPAGLLDAAVQAGMLDALGKNCCVEGDRIRIAEDGRLSSTLDWNGRSIRNTLLVLGALVARTGAGRVPLPGGCNLGDRKYDLHELVLTSLGARVWTEGDELCAEAPKGLTGADIILPLRSTGATENALLAGALAKGRTTVWNPHIRPEILELAAMLRAMGARIEVHGQERIVIEGAEALRGVQFRVMPDNVEALTWFIGAFITGGQLEIADFPATHLEVPLIFLRESGARHFIDRDRLILLPGRPYPVEFSTGPYPGINSDMQPLFAAMGACASGETRVVDLRFSNRYGYLDEFAKLGITSSVVNGTARIKGGDPLTGTHVRALDLRTGAALALLGLVAQGTTIVEDAWQIERGYDAFLSKLTSLGGRAHTQ